MFPHCLYGSWFRNVSHESENSGRRLHLSILFKSKGPMSLQFDLSPAEVEKIFLSLRNRNDIAKMLDVDLGTLEMVLSLPETKRYRTFKIPKSGGGYRQIFAPIPSLQTLQHRLNHILQIVYRPKRSVHGFVPERNIYTNAINHVKKNYVFNVDIENFFPAITTARVRGLLMAIPYKLPMEAATTIAQICCLDEGLPQGSPSSPIIANMICAKMDTRLRRLAEKHRCYYTRYADDITFSTKKKVFPAAIAVTNEDVSGAKVGYELDKAITENGFAVNNRKVRLQSCLQRQEVTGLTVNEKPNVNRRYIRRIRAILHNWDTYGEEHAQRQLDINYSSRGRTVQAPPIEKVVRGQIEFVGMIRGKHDEIYQKLLIQLHKLAPDAVQEKIIKEWHESQKRKDSVEMREFQKAIMDAFPSESKLKQLTKLRLGTNLAKISTDTNLQDITFELIEWAKTQGTYTDLVENAFQENPGNPILFSFVKQYYPYLIKGEI